MVGMSGVCCQRVAVVTASARNFPALMSSIDTPMGAEMDLPLPANEIGQHVRRGGPPVGSTPHSSGLGTSGANQALMRPIPERGRSSDDPTEPRKAAGKVEQRLVPAGPADQGEPGRQPAAVPTGNRHLRQARKASDAGEPHDAGAEGV